MSPAGPFPLMCVAYLIIGFALSLQNAHCNGFVASSGGNIATKIGFLHASYGTYLYTCLRNGCIKEAVSSRPLASTSG